MWTERFSKGSVRHKWGDDMYRKRPGLSDRSPTLTKEDRRNKKVLSGREKRQVQERRDDRRQSQLAPSEMELSQNLVALPHRLRLASPSCSSPVKRSLHERIRWVAEWQRVGSHRSKFGAAEAGNLPPWHALWCPCWRATGGALQVSASCCQPGAKALVAQLQSATISTP